MLKWLILTVLLVMTTAVQANIELRFSEELQSSWPDSWLEAKQKFHGLNIPKNDVVSGRYSILIPSILDEDDIISVDKVWLEKGTLYLYSDGVAIGNYEFGVDGEQGEEFPLAINSISIEPFNKTGQTLSAILDLQSRLFTTQPQISLHSFAEFHADQISQRQYLSFVTGGLLTLIAYNLFLFMFIRKKSFLLYSLFLILVVSSFPLFMQLLPGLLWTAAPQPYLALMNLTMVCLLMFVRQFLKLTEYTPNLARVNLLMISLISLNVLMSAWLDATAVYLIGNILGGLVILLNIVCAVRRLRQGAEQALWYLLAFIVIPVAYVIGRLSYSGWFVLPMDFAMLMYTAYFVEGVILAMALGMYYRQQAIEKEKALQSARRDELTGVYNRHGYSEFVVGPFKQGLYKQGIIALLDLNNLKRMNDENGHGAGDKYILKTVELLDRFLNSYQVYRFGGDEFILYLESNDLEKDEGLTASGLNKVNIELQAIFGELYGVSYGVQKIESGELQQAMKQADHKMYDMKYLQ